MTTNKPDNENVQHSSWTSFNSYPTCQYSFATPPLTLAMQPVNQEKQLKSLGDAYLEQGKAFYLRQTPDSLRRAIESYNQAITIYEQLPKDNPQFQNNLASAYYNRGNAQHDLGTPDDLHAAIASFNQAIAIGEQLPKDNPEFQNGLANAYYNRGNAQRDLGTSDDLHAAIASFNQAIAIGEQLPKDNPQFQNDLAGAYHNRGNAQYDLGTPDDLQAAIALFNQVIDIRELLPKDNPQFQNNLAGAYSNRGAAQHALGTPDDLRAAIASCTQAIAIGEQLPKDHLKFQYDLVGAYVNRGAAQSDLGDFQTAIESYNQAIAIGTRLPKDQPQFQEFLANAFGNKANACSDLNQWEEAQEAAEAGLDLLRNLEKAGVYRFRKIREWLFGIAIKTYLANFATCHFLPELLLEHLDPNQPGSAPESEVMHNDALRGLQQLYLQLSDSYPEMLPTLQQTEATLEQIRSLYLVGTAAGAKLMAEHYARHLRDSQKTLVTLQDYIQHNPLDPQGYVNLASVQLDNPELFPADHSAKTWESYFKAAHILSQLPTAPLVQNTLITLLDLCIELRFIPVLFDYPYLVGEMAKDMVQRRQDLARQWVAELPKSIKNGLGNTEAVLTDFQQLRNTWETITQSDFEKWQQQQRKQRLQAKRQRLETLLADLPLDIEQVHQRAAYIVQQARQWIAENASKYEYDWQAEAKMRPFLDQALQCVYRQLHGYEYNHSLFDLLGKAAYSILDKREFWHLKRVLQFYCDYLRLDDDLLLKEIGYHLGMAVEESLLNRLYRPLKDQGKRFMVHDEDSFPRRNVVYFFNDPPPGTKPYKLLLDPMVAMLNRLVHSDHTGDEFVGVEKELWDRIKNHAPQLLVRQSKQVRDKRKQALEGIKVIRNKCDHAEEPQEPTTPDEVEKMLEEVLGPSEEAFFRYFVGAFVRESK